MDGLRGGPDAAPLGEGNHDPSEQTVTIKGGRRIVSVPGIDPVEVGLARQQALADQVTGLLSTPALMVWRSQRALLISRSEARLPQFRDAATELQGAGWPVLQRKSGGGACPVGPGTVQVSLIEPARAGATMNAKYAVLAALMQAMFCHYQIVAQIGLVAGAYCPGNYDLAVAGNKIAGMSQYWFRNRCGVRCVVTAASINVEEAPEALACVVNRFYTHAGSPLRCNAVALTNMRLCGGTSAVLGSDFVAAVMNQLGSIANTPSEIASAQFHPAAHH
jgi:lipoate-protein ligase A